MAIRFNPKEHEIIENEDVRGIRRKVGGDSSVVVYRHRKTKNYVLAERRGNILRELKILVGWPHLSSNVMQDIIRQFNPTRTTIQQDANALRRARDKKDAVVINSRRKYRRLVREVKDKSPRSQRDNPHLNWPEVPGEGI